MSMFQVKQQDPKCLRRFQDAVNEGGAFRRRTWDFAISFVAFAHELPDVAEDVGRLRLWSCGASASDLVFLPDPSSILKPNLYRLAASLRVAQPTAIPEVDPRILLALSLTRRLSTRTTRAPLAPAKQYWVAGAF
jgi:hypothetical protein